MLQEFNASTDQVLELSGLADQLKEGEAMEQWTFEDPVQEAKPKVRSDGY